MRKNVMNFLTHLRRSSLFRAAGTYGFFSLLNKAMPFLLMPVLTRYLSPEDYGIVAIFNIMVSITMPFILCNFHVAYTRAYFSPERFEHSIYMGNITLAIFAFGTLGTFVLFIFRNPIGRVFSFPANWVWVVGIVALSQSLVQMPLKGWQVREKAKSFGLFQFSAAALNVILVFALVILLEMTWEGRILPKLAVTPIWAVVGIIILKRNSWIILRWDKRCLAHAFRFGIPLIPHNLAGIINSTVDRLFIVHMIGIATAGIYTVAYQIGTIIYILAVAFNQAYAPWLFERLSRNDASSKHRIVCFTYVYFASIICLALALAITAPSILRIMVGKAFQASYSFVIWIAFGSAFLGMYLMVVNYIFFVEKTHLVTIITFIGAMTNILLNYIFIKFNGAMGAAQATALTHFAKFIMVWYLATKVYPMPWKSPSRLFDKASEE